MSKTYTEPRREKNDARFAMPTLQIITTTTTTLSKDVLLRSFLSLSLFFSLSMMPLYTTILSDVGGSRRQ